MRRDVHLDSEAETIAYRLCVAHGASAEEALHMVQLWKDDCVVLAHQLNPRMLLIVVTELGAAFEESKSHTKN